MTLDIASRKPKTDPVEEYVREQMEKALDALTDDFVAGYIRDHYLSRGALVGNA